MNSTLQALLQAATQLTQSGHLKEATEAIQRSLKRAAPHSAARPAPPADVLDGCVFEVDPNRPATARAKHIPQAEPQPRPAAPDRPQPRVWQPAGTPAARSHTLYVPPAANAGNALPLVVMLHGCTQDADDFAAGTGMNERARERGFFVLYPVQSQAANPQRCWNWFKHNHQQRGSGEPAWIAGLTREVIARHAIDTRRVYIAGLSAGAAMATIVAQAYPELFAAVGVHSGLPRGVARNAPQALALMQTGMVGGAAADLHSTPRRAGLAQVPTASTSARAQVPTIVFHGDQDHTVHPRNGDQVLADGLTHDSLGAPARRRIEHGVSRHGRRYTRSLYYSSDHSADHGAADAAVAEHWLVHGAGHAWAGGHAAGSYTDPSGPDASLEMVRFFFEHPHPNC